MRNFALNPAADLSLLEAGLAPRVRVVNSHDHDALTRRLMNSYRQAKAAQQRAPAVFQPGVEWEAAIRMRYVSYLKALDHHDVSSLSQLLQNFFRNGGATDFGIGAYRNEDAARGRLGIANGSTLQRKRFVNQLLQHVAVWKQHLQGIDVGRLSLPPIGNPWGYVIDGHLILSVSCRMHYTAACATEWLADIPRPVVAEIGGGFGGFASYLLAPGKPYTYLDFDLPEVLLIAQYYLLNMFPEKRFLLFGEADIGEISPDVMEAFDVILLPNFQLPTVASSSVDLFVNTISLSEMELPAVQGYLAQIARICRGYFFHENSMREKRQFWTQRTEVSSASFPIPSGAFKKLSSAPSLWLKGYETHLYQRMGSAEPGRIHAHSGDRI